ncbi:MAG: GH25 family lysozyme [Kofleriaceae bacterium]
MRWGLLAFVSACTTTTADTNSVEQGITMCPDQVVEGIDVFNGQGAIDWSMVSSSGRGFAFIKATQGTYNKQTTFPTNWTNAQTNAVKRSPYHFFDGTNDGVAQANAFLEAVTAAGGLGSGDLPAMLDIECPTSATEANTQSNCEYTGDSGWVDTATLNQRIFDWLDTVEAATGRKPIIYSYPSWFADVKVTDSRLADYPLFIASYNSCATIPAPWTTAVFWQYSATGTVPGIAGTKDVDLDRFFGSADDLNGFAIQPAPPPPDYSADAGIDPPPTESPAGCGCHSSGDPPWWLAFALLFRRRAVKKLPHS